MIRTGHFEVCKAGTNDLKKNDLLIGNFKMTILIIDTIQK